MTDQRTCPGSHSIAHPAPALRNDEHLCRGCVRHTERILGDLVALTRDVETTVTRQDRVGTRNGARAIGHDRPLPVNVHTSDKARKSLALLFEWADFVAERNSVRGLPSFARTIPLGTLVPRAVAILLHYSDWMRLDQQGPDCANAIRSVRRDLRALVDAPPERLYAGPCEADLGYDKTLGYRCSGQLFRRWGSEEITCDGYRPDRLIGEHRFGCGTVHATAERRTWMRAEVEERLLPLRVLWEDLYELVPGCELDWKTVRQWTQERRQRVAKRDTNGLERVDSRGKPMVTVIVTPPRLEPQAWDCDVPLYRGSDVLKLAEDGGLRRGRRRRTRRSVA